MQYHHLVMKLYSALLFLAKYGPRNFLLRVYNRSTMWDSVHPSERKPEGTSVTDSLAHVSYLEFCGSIQADSRDFRRFRRNNSIISVYDHVPLDIGKKYFNEIQANLALLNDNLDWSRVRELDSIGKPLQYYFRNLGNLSPTMLRYVKTTLDFELRYPFTSFENVVEIGVGFGGQSALILDRWNLKSYTYFDLPEVLNVVKHYVRKSHPNSSQNLYFLDGRSPKEGKYDFVFSNYAFSELDRETQIKYLDSVILLATHGYITWNNLGNYYHDAYSVADLLRIIPNSELSPEIPLTSKYNTVISW
jgi:hypothetical protein